MATSMMTISTSSSPYMPAHMMAKSHSGGIYAMLLPIPALGVLGLLLTGSGRSRRLAGKRWIPYLTGSLGLLIATAWLLAASGCGYSSNGAGNGTQRGTTTVMITGASGNLSHSASVSFTVQ
jgi:hypothetical protein